MSTERELAAQAQKLVRILQSVVSALDRFDDPTQRDYIHAVAEGLSPLVAELHSAVFFERSRSDAERVLPCIRELMREVTGAATKGEMDLFADDTLDKYWQLSTLFQESRFPGQSL